MDVVWVEIGVLALLVGLNGTLAMAEIAILSARPTRLEQLHMAGDRRAQVALALQQAPADFLATVQVGITLVGIVSGAFGGVTLADNLAGFMSRWTPLAPYAETAAVTLVVLGITYFSLVFGELAPKRVALAHAERIAVALAPFMQRLCVLATPAVRVLSASTEAVVRLIPGPDTSGAAVTDEEIRLLIRQWTDSGVLTPTEQEMIEGVLRLGDRKVGAVMTPRPQVVWLDLDEPAEVLVQRLRQHRHARYPVARQDLDNTVGVVHTKDILAAYLDRSGLPDLEALAWPPLFVPEQVSALQVLDLFRQHGTDLALVVNEFGGVEGLVTGNDVLEDVAGHLPLSQEDYEPKIIRRSDDSYLVDGLLPIDEFKDLLGLQELPYENVVRYQTVGGLVVARLGRIPRIGDVFELDGYRVEVVDMDGLRVDRVLVSPHTGKENHRGAEDTEDGTEE